MVCEDCLKNKESAIETHCPYSQEINDDLVLCVLCDDCYYDRCQEI
jgi:hypothetical protein